LRAAPSSGGVPNAGEQRLPCANPAPAVGGLDGTDDTAEVEDAVVGSGSALIAGGTLIFGSTSTINVTFDNGAGTPTYGALVLQKPRRRSHE